MMSKAAEPQGGALSRIIAGLIIGAAFAIAGCSGSNAIPTTPTAAPTSTPSLGNLATDNTTSVADDHFTTAALNSTAGTTNTSTTAGRSTETTNTVNSKNAPLLAVGDTNVPTVSGSLCGYDPANPYPCCSNQNGTYGNCTGWAWQQAKNHGWGPAVPSGLHSAQDWGNNARNGGYLVESTPTVGSIAVRVISATLGHVCYVVAVSGGTVTCSEEKCGYLLAGGGPYGTTTAYSASTFNGGFIHEPIPSVNMMIWSGAASAGNNGTLTIARGATVSFGFSLLRSNVVGSSSFKWVIAGFVASSNGTFSKTFTTSGVFPVSVTVTNAKGVPTTTNATVVVR